MFSLLQGLWKISGNLPKMAIEGDPYATARNVSGSCRLPGASDFGVAYRGEDIEFGGCRFV